MTDSIHDTDPAGDEDLLITVLPEANRHTASTPQVGSKCQHPPQLHEKVVAVEWRCRGCGRVVIRVEKPDLREGGTG